MREKSILFWHVGLVCLVLVIFAQSIGFPFSEWDDISFILRNPLIVSPSRVPWANLFFTPEFTYIAPVTMWIQAGLYAASGGEAWTFHALSVLLHATNASLLFALAYRLSCQHWAAGCSTLLFVCHPLVVEPVAWSTGLKDQIMLCFLLLATKLFLQQSAQKKEPTRTGMGLAVLVGLLAILSKPSAVLLGGIWLSWLISRSWSGDNVAFRSWLGAVSLLVMGLMLGFASTVMRSTLLKSSMSSVKSGPWDAFLALGHQLTKFLWPQPMHPYYFYSRPVSPSHPLVWLGFVAVLVMLGLAWRERKSPGKLLGLSLLVATYLPVSQVLPFRRFLSDSYTHVPLAGVVLYLSVHLSSSPWLTKSLSRPLFRKVAGTSFLLLVLAWSGLSFLQTQRWSSNVRLWTPVTQTYPTWYYPWIHLAQGSTAAKQHKHALIAYQKTFQLDTPTQYLSSLAKTLLHNQQWNEAECIMLADLKHGPKPKRALRNYVLFLTHQSTYQPKYLSDTLRAFFAFQKFQRRYPPLLQQRIQQRKQALYKSYKRTKQRVRFSAKHCSSLKKLQR